MLECDKWEERKKIEKRSAAELAEGPHIRFVDDTGKVHALLSMEFLKQASIYDEEDANSLMRELAEITTNIEPTVLN